MFGGPRLLGGVPAGRAWPRDLNAGLRDPWNAGATTPRRRSSDAEGASEREARAIHGLGGGKRRGAITREMECLVGHWTNSRKSGASGAKKPRGEISE